MINVVREALINLFISIFASSIFAPIMIEIMYKFDQVSVVKKTKQGIGKGDNSLFRRIMRRDETNGTPNMGGLLILVVVPLIIFFFSPRNPIIDIFLIGFIVFGFWGLLDVVFTNAIRDNEKLKTQQETFTWRIGKLLLSILINIVVTYLLFKTGIIPNIPIWKGVMISFTPILIPVIAVISQFAIYSSELTDGMDGLMIGIMGVIYTALAALLLIQGRFEFIHVIAITLGAIVVDSYFNIPPARFWNGGPGAMPLGFGAFYIGLVTGNIIPYFIISSITWIIMSSSMIQILSMKLFKRRVFKIAPIHHHFQALGWPQYKVTMRFWLFTILTAIIGIFAGMYV